LIGQEKWKNRTIGQENFPKKAIFVP